MATDAPVNAKIVAQSLDVKITSTKMGLVAYNFVGDAGAKKAKQGWIRTFIYAFQAGVFLSFGGIMAQRVAHGTTLASNAHMGKFALGAVFPIGLCLITIIGADLYTGNCMALPAAFCQKKCKWWQVLKSWWWSWFGNLVGCLFFAYFLSYLPDVLGANKDADMYAFLHKMATTKANEYWYRLFLKGIGCNILVCCAVWLSMAAEEVMSKMVACWFPICTFITIGFEHSVANMYFVPVGCMYDADSLWGPGWGCFGMFMVNHITAVSLGNLVGGCLFLGCAYWYFFIYQDSCAFCGDAKYAWPCGCDQKDPEAPKKDVPMQPVPAAAPAPVTGATIAVEPAPAPAPAAAPVPATTA